MQTTWWCLPSLEKRSQLTRFKSTSAFVSFILVRFSYQRLCDVVAQLHWYPLLFVPDLLDPNYIEKVAPDKVISAAKGEEEVFAAGSAIGSSLKQLAERRTDIFGVGLEETQIGKKVFSLWNFYVKSELRSIGLA